MAGEDAADVNPADTARDRNDAAADVNPADPARDRNDAAADANPADPARDRNDAAADVEPNSRPPQTALAQQPPHQCHVCDRAFASARSLHGHMKSHPSRKWRGVIPPSMRPGVELQVAESLLLLSTAGGEARRRMYGCGGCGRQFGTRQALGGHRARQNRRQGCLGKAEAAAQGGKRRRPPLMDLNAPPPEDGEEEEASKADATGNSSVLKS